MNLRHSWPQALGGGPLIGSRWVRQVYIDEAGTSAKERTAIVVGLIINGDTGFLEAERGITLAIEKHIPSHMQDNFVFHAKDVYGKWRKKEGWDIEKCNSVACAWLDIIAAFKPAIVFSYWSKSTFDLDRQKAELEQSDNAHLIAFVQCVGLADHFIGKFYPNEVANIWAEDCSKMKTRINRALAHLRSGSFRKFDVDDEIRHIKNDIAWTSKAGALPLQLADACAFAFNRRLNQRRGWEVLWKALGENREIELVQDRLPGLAGRFVLASEMP
jgi:hypothetical protein